MSKQVSQYRVRCGLSDDGLAEAPESYLIRKDRNNRDKPRFYPVRLGDKIGRGDDKTEIFAKLGNGGDGTVWLGRKIGAKKDIWRAVKVFATEKGNSRGQIEAVQKVERCGVVVAGCTTPKDAFYITGPGPDLKRDTHLCLSMRVTGPSLRMYIEYFKPPLHNRVTIALRAVSIVKKTLEGGCPIDDFSDSNLCLGLKSTFYKYTEAQMREALDLAQPEEMDLDVYTDGRKLAKGDRDRPLYIPEKLYAPVYLKKKFDDIDENMIVEVVDVAQESGWPAIVAASAAPEALVKAVKEEASPPVKFVGTFQTTRFSYIWSLGILIGRVLTEQYLFGTLSATYVAEAQNAYLAMDHDQQIGHWQQEFRGYNPTGLDDKQIKLLATLLQSIFARNASLDDISKMLKWIKDGEPSSLPLPPPPSIKSPGSRSHSRNRHTSNKGSSNTGPAIISIKSTSRPKSQTDKHDKRPKEHKASSSSSRTSVSLTHRAAASPPPPPPRREEKKPQQKQVKPEEKRDKDPSDKTKKKKKKDSSSKPQ